MKFNRYSLAFTIAISNITFVNAAQKADLSFFVTSSTQSGNLGGLKGADQICSTLAKNVNAKKQIWRAYLSTHKTQDSVQINARDRIGNGPWYNAKGTLIALNVADLHGDIERDSNLINQFTALTESGEKIDGRIRPEGNNNEHDILTGSDSHGRAFPAGAMRFNNLSCNNWTYSGSEQSAMVGHHDRLSSWNTSWNSSHATQGCSLDDLKLTGGVGRLYCFAID